ncbi:MAG: recombinase family protein [Candidatus Thermoplasmatota archaeon]|nr:recombinase family protein [Candidatus Thermoplasmatota archaeon]
MPDLSIKKNRAVLYIRVSTEDQAKEGYSLSAQEERLKAYCLAKEWNVANTYIDDGYSGRSDDRPAYRRMMADMDSWDILVVMKMDRIHRNSKNFTTMMENLNDNGKEFTSMQESFDTTTAMGRFVMDIIQRIAQLESEQIGERVYIGMLQKAKEGTGWLGFNIPYGFEIENDRIVQVPGEAAVIRLMYEKYIAGSSLSEICDHLMNNNILTKKGLRKWEKKTISRILSNPLNCGYLHWEEIIYKGDIQAIVDVDTFNRVQRLMKRGDPTLIENNEMAESIPA